MPEIKNDKIDKHDHPRDEKTCEQTVNLCCNDNKPPEYHYIEPKHEYCCYEIAMKRIRVTDTNIDGKLELMISGYANHHEAVFPGLGTYFVVSKKWGWVNINKTIGEFKVKKGSTMVVQLGADAIENDIWAAGSAEIGSNEINKYVKIGCGTGISNEIMEIGLHAVKAGKVKHKIEIEFCAYEKPCCC